MEDKKTLTSLEAMTMAFMPAALEGIKASVTSDLGEFIKGRIAKNFPNNLNAVVDSFFDAEIAPALKELLMAHRDEIISNLKEKIVDYATSKILHQIDEAIEHTCNGF